ncbi:MAG: hypothetical protein AB8G05_22345 [Oligoflexales bacterium]
MHKLIILLVNLGIFSVKINASIFNPPVVWSKWDSFNLTLCEATPHDQESLLNIDTAINVLLGPDPTQTPDFWSKSIILFRATSRPLDSLMDLNNINLGNLYGQLRFLETKAKHLGKEKAKTLYLKAIKVKINMRLISDYFHCEQGKCEFRLTCHMGPCSTSLETISVPYNRVGIKLGTENIQLSRCGRSHVCPEDICLKPSEGEVKFKACVNDEHQDLDCYYGFTKEGHRLSYKIIGQSDSKRIDWEGNIREQLHQITSEIY